MFRAIQSGLSIALFVLSTAIANADNTAPSIPGSIYIDSVTSSEIKLNWSPSWDDQSVHGYNIYRDGSYVATVPENNFLDTGLASNQSYYYWIVAFDQAGNFSSTSSWAFGTTKIATIEKSFSFLDTEINTAGSYHNPDQPPAPNNINAWNQTNGSVKVTWDRPQWHSTIKGYNLYRNGIYVHTIDYAEEWVEWGLPSGSQQTYDLVAIDIDGRFSVHSNQVSVFVTGAQPQSNYVTAPDNLRSESVSHNSKMLTWEAAKASRSIKGYNIYRNGSYIATAPGLQYEDSGLAPDTEYRYQIVAFDDGDNYSDYSTVLASSTWPTSAATVTNIAPPPPNTPELDGYYLAFSDEFNGSSLDYNKWNTSYLWGPNLTTNNEEQYYVDIKSDPDFGYQPFSGNGEYLSIKASRTPDWMKSKANWKNYVSGVMTSYDSFQFTYGYAEARIRPPKGVGMFSAFWLLNARYDGITPEIDIAEFLGESPDVVYQTYHYFDQAWNLISTPSFETWTDDYTDEFHTYAVRWSPNEIIWYVDGIQTHRISHDQISAQPMYILFNLAIGGNWPKSPDWTTPFPSSFDIDYVRIYRK